MTELQGHEDRLEISADSGVFVRSREEGSHGRSRVGGSAPPLCQRAGCYQSHPWDLHPAPRKRDRGRDLGNLVPLGPKPDRLKVPWSRPCRTGTAAPEPKRSGDPPHAPWFASATHGAPAYPCSRSRRILSDSISRSPYDNAQSDHSHHIAPSCPRPVEDGSGFPDTTIMPDRGERAMIARFRVSQPT